uniref:Uncharacterized protein n=1 Tax=Brassica campestris TaxID=3711 RepID=A0A3P5YUX6_BRACM|nr:unnamed protein product [Brassica rapa]
MISFTVFDFVYVCWCITVTVQCFTVTDTVKLNV